MHTLPTGAPGLSWNMLQHVKAPRAASGRARAAGHQTRATPVASKGSVSRRKQQLFELDDAAITSPQNTDTAAASSNTALLDEGWGVIVPSSTPASSPAPKVKRAKKTVDTAASSKKATPYVGLNSAAGRLGLQLLQTKLTRQGKVTKEDVDKLKNTASTEAKKKTKLPGTQASQAASTPAYIKRQPRAWDEEDDYYEEDEATDITNKPSFELNLGDDGMEIVEYDANGNAIKRLPGSVQEQQDSESDDDDLFDFLDDDAEGWSQFEDLDDEELEDRLASSASASSSGRTARGTAIASALPSKRKAKGKAAVSAIPEPETDEEADLNEKDDWGLDEVKDRKGSLLRRFGVVGEQDAEDDMEVQWGGSIGTAIIDMDEQEELLSRMFKPHKVKQFMQLQKEIEDNVNDMRRKASGKAILESKKQSRMRIIGGTATGKVLVSSKGDLTRPMMEKVRAAIFNMIQSQAGTVNALPSNARWLDLFAGTGSVGLEALSRGCRECHLVEMDPWVCKSVLAKNISTCGFERKAIVHTSKAEDFLKRALQFPRFAGGAFDFISMCPPYLLVSYPELFGLLEKSPLIHPNTVLFVEYPKQLKSQVPQTVGPLEMVRDRKYGRTYVRVYGPAGGNTDDFDEDEF